MPADELNRRASEYAGKIGVDSGKVRITKYKVTSKGGAPAVLGESKPHTDLAPYRKAGRDKEYPKIKPAG